MKQTGTYTRKTVNIEKIHSNLEQQVIQITEDKLKLILNEHIQFMEKKSSWIAPFSIIVTLMVVFSTTNFIDAMLSADTWKAIFVITLILTIIWLIKSLYMIYKAKTLEDLINKIKNTS